MKKNIFSILFLLVCTNVCAQYEPKKSDIGKDCATENGKLGKWKEVTVTEKIEGSTNRSTSTSNTINGGLNGNIGTKSVGVSGSVGVSNSSGTNNSSSTTNTSSRTYKDIQCIEDKNANLPQRTPIRW